MKSAMTITMNTFIHLRTTNLTGHFVHSVATAAPGILQLTTLYSGLHNEKQCEESFTSSFGSALSPEAMDGPASRYGRGSGALIDEHEEADVRQQNDGRGRFAFLRGERSMRCRLLLCCLILSMIWIPVIVVWSLRGGLTDDDSSPAATSFDHNSTRVSGTPAPWEVTPPDTIIAYVRNVTLSDETKQLYELIRSEGAEAMGRCR